MEGKVTFLDASIRVVLKIPFFQALGSRSEKYWVKSFAH